MRYEHALSNVDFIVQEPIANRIRTGKIIQKDRFAEYHAADMVWAEPLGLAAWETVDREEVLFGINERLRLKFEGQFLQPRCVGMCVIAGESPAAG